VIPFGVVVLGLALYTLFHPGLRKDLNGEVADRDRGLDPGDLDVTTGDAAGNGRATPRRAPLLPVSPQDPPRGTSVSGGPDGVGQSLAERK
jgi:hypothetical protein